MSNSSLAACAAALALVLALSSCGAKGTEGGITAAADEREPDHIEQATTTYRVNIPDLLDESVGSGDVDYSDFKTENPVIGEDAARFHNRYSIIKVDVDSIKTVNYVAWGDETPDKLFDLYDGVFREKQTKMGGSVQNSELIIEFVADKSTLAAYAFVTGNDSGTYPERSPSSWTLYGSVDGGDNWAVLDSVFDSAIEPGDHVYYGYTVDEESRGEYSHYRVVFTASYASTAIGSFQLNEFYLYADKKG